MEVSTAALDGSIYINSAKKHGRFESAIEESVGALKQCRTGRKIRHLGFIGNVDRKEMRSRAPDCSVVSVQNRYILRPRIRRRSGVLREGKLGFLPVVPDRRRQRIEIGQAAKYRAKAHGVSVFQVALGLASRALSAVDAAHSRDIVSGARLEAMRRRQLN